MPKLGDIYSNIKNGTVSNSPLEIELECSSVNVAPISVATSLSSNVSYDSRNISKVGSELFFNNQADSPSSGSLGIYDINTNEITNVSCPHSTYGASFIYVNNAVYIIGGFTHVGNVRHNKIMKYNGGIVDTLEEVLPEEQSDMSCNAIGNYIYIIGGRTNTSYKSTIYRLDTTTDTIELMPYSLKVACSSTSSAVYQNRYIYVVWGIGYTYNQNKIQIIDIIEGNVSLLSKDLPMFKLGSGTMIKDDFLYVFGGYDESMARTTIYKKYLLDESDWVLDTQTLVYARGHFGYTSDEKGYYHIIGGQPNDGSRYYETGKFGLPSSDVEIRYNITSNGTEPEEPTETTEEVTTGTFESITSAYTGSSKNSEMYVIENNIYVPAWDTGVMYYSLLNKTYNTIDTSTYVYGIINLGDYFLYAFAINADGTVKYMHKINTKTKTITNLTQEITIPVSSSYSYTAIGGIGYIVAGQSIYKLEDDVLSVLESGTIPINISGGYAVSDKNKYIYMYSGNNTQGYRYNTETGEFAQLPDFPYTYTYFALNVVGNYLYYIGGKREIASTGTTIFEKLNLTELESWETETSLSSVSAYINSCVYENYIYSLTKSNGTYYTNQFWKYLPQGQGKKIRTGIKYTAPITVSENGSYYLKAVAFEKV